MLSEESGT